MFFVFNSDELLPEASPILDDLATLVARRYAHRPVAITGYSDDIEHPRYARVLSLHRAERLASYLWQHGLDQHYLFPAGLGAELKLSEGCTIRSALANRRIEFTF